MTDELREILTDLVVLIEAETNVTEQVLMLAAVSPSAKHPILGRIAIINDGCRKTAELIKAAS